MMRRSLDRREYTDLVMQTHYARRFPPVSFAYVMETDGVVEGVVTFGRPLSSTLRTGVLGPDLQDKVWELNRLVLRSNRKGDASRLVGFGLRQLRADFGDCVVVSFADPTQTHRGIVYQATNFLYCGLSAKRTDWTVRGREHLHSATIAAEFKGVEGRRVDAMRAKYGDDFYLKPRPRKHRYVYINAGKRLTKAFSAALRYPIEGYPKPC